MRPLIFLNSFIRRGHGFRRGLGHCQLGLAVMLLSAASLYAQPSESNVADLDFFESKIRPLLLEKCIDCHNAEEQEAELRLDSLAGMLHGGVSGPALTAGKPEQSLMVAAISYRDPALQMPPDEQLSPAQQELIKQWIARGAVHPDGLGEPPPPRRGTIDLQQARQFWAFQPLRQVEVPDVQANHWPRGAIDRFVLSAMQDQGLTPNGETTKQAWLRRVTIGLTGLPPTPEDIHQFLIDQSPTAYESVVDRLLASASYGEHWGRHWLDIVRYADSNGLDENVAHGNAWRYRDYVVRSLNTDKPLDQFIVEQIAGDLLVAQKRESFPPPESADESGEVPDLLPRDQQERDSLIATGFLAMGPKVLAEPDQTKMRMDIIDEQIDTLGKAFLGMTLGCARCHDHKFDPVSAVDYYALAGIFSSTRTMESLKTVAKWHENSLATPAQWRQHQADSVASDSAMGVRDESQVEDLAVHVRGSHLTLGQTVARGLPAVLQAGPPLEIAEGSSGRLELARWLVSQHNPLTPRVLVNRIWRWHFGRGLVATTDNFGQLGQTPSHPELLEWLATEFVGDSWSLKGMHRRIVLSSVYRTGSQSDPQRLAIDPDNEFLWRSTIGRLQAESIRDAILMVSGQLDRSMGGSMLNVGNREFVFNHTSQDNTTYATTRRSLYLPVIRNNLYDVFTLFDYTTADVTNGDRQSSIVAPQALFMLNSDIVLEAAQHMVDRLLQGGPSQSPEVVLDVLYENILGRLPKRDERQRVLGFVRSFGVDGQGGQPQGVAALAENSSPLAAEADLYDAWVAICQSLLASNEFLTIP